MAIKNYTSDKPLEKIFAELQQTLATHGAKQISYDYDDDGKVHGVSFTINVHDRFIPIKLPARVERRCNLHRPEHGETPALGQPDQRLGPQPSAMVYSPLDYEVNGFQSSRADGSPSPRTRGACRDTSADLQARETQSIPLVIVAPRTVEIDRRDLPNSVGRGESTIPRRGRREGRTWMF
jgi:hypothetical protein